MRAAEFFLGLAIALKNNESFQVKESRGILTSFFRTVLRTVVKLKWPGLMAVLLVVALSLKFFLAPVQETLVSLTSYTSINEPATAAAKHFSNLKGSPFVRVIAYTDNWKLAFHVVEATLADAESRNEPIQTVIVPESLPGPWVLPERFKNLPIVVVRMDTLNLEPFYNVVSNSLLGLGRTLIFASAPLASHRMGANLMTFMEERFSIKIPAITVAPLALSRDQEQALSPVCEFSASDDGAHVLDLGCLSLKISRYDQLQPFDPTRTYFHLERIDAFELLLTLQPPSDKILSKGTSLETLRASSND